MIDSKEYNTIYPQRFKTIRVDAEVWKKLRSIKKERSLDSYNDALRMMLSLGSIRLGNSNVTTIKYNRKRGFITIGNEKEEWSLEFEYNDIPEREEFTLDITIIKIFFKREAYTPTAFFGIDEIHKHYSGYYLDFYLRAVAAALQREFRVKFSQAPFQTNYLSLPRWRQFYYENDLSEDSFNEDIAIPLKLHMTERPSKEYVQRMKESIAGYMRLEGS